MASHITGINRWAASIRKRMVNDPGRQDLDDHILCNGFLFLDEYLEDILLGARSEPIIELTKTPGRRKDVSKKDRVATTANVKLFSLQRSPDKENMPATQPPVLAKKGPTSFQKALLKASRENEPSVGMVFHTQLPHNLSTRNEGPFGDIFVSTFERQYPQQDAQGEKTVEVPVTPPCARITGVSVKMSPSLSVAPAAAFASALAPEAVAIPGKPDDTAGVDLSVIVEGDEDDMSRASLPSSRRTGPIIRDKEISYHIPTDPNNPNGPMATVTVSYNPNADDDDDTQAFPAAFDRSYNDSEPTSTASSFPIDPYARDYETHELPQIIPEHRAQSPNQNVPAPSPSGSSLTRKASVPVFPSLPAPSPPRRTNRDSSVACPVIGSTRPNAAVGHGTRSSWLHKARDVTAKRTSVVAGVKRKSGDLPEELNSTMSTDSYERATKVAKTSFEDGIWDAPTGEKPSGKLSIQPFKPVLPSRNKEQPSALTTVAAMSQIDNSEGMINTLKRTIEGLGARVGKGMGKSLGGAAATAAAAEAKAAAEARLAQREAKGVEGVKNSRLSVSDLVGTYETGGLEKGEESLDKNMKPLPSPPAPPAPHVLSTKRASISTTPSNTPPHGSFEPLSPGRNAYTIPKFTVQRAINPEPSFHLPESQPSTQSTYVSSIFDDHSSWHQSSFITDYTASQGLSQSEAPQHNFALAYGSKKDELSKEVAWTQNQTKPSTLRKDSSNLVARNERTASPGCPLNHKDSSSPSLFNHERQDGDMEEGDIELEHDIAEHTDVKVVTSSDDKIKDGSSQEITASVQSGLVAQASTFFSKVMSSSVSSALGSSKRGKAEPVKSIQLAAAAAKKQQEEADRKAARLREMDKRRAAIASKKADQGTVEKVKQQGDRNKRERDEGPDKSATKTIARKIEEEVGKKRKVVVEIEKKSLSKKPLSKDKKDMATSRIGKPTIMTSVSHSHIPSSNLSKSFKLPGIPASSSQPSVKLVGTSQSESKTTLLQTGNNSVMGKDISEDVLQPAQALQAQMYARVQAQMLQARQEEPLIPSESIELPDINSEYSNSDDEDRPRTFDPPDWAQSPVLSQALQSQSRLNPDDIFGPVRPLRMEEIFTTRHSRFRARTSSANWAGTDELTTEEEQNYAKRMGYLG